MHSPGTERVKEILQCVACDDALRVLREEGLCILHSPGDTARKHIRAEPDESRRAGK